MVFAKNTPLLISIPDYFKTLDCSNIQQLKAVQEITSFVLCDDYIKESLLLFQNDIPYKSWEIIADKSNQENQINVKIKSRGFLPSAYCLVKIDVSNQIVFKECQYNK